MIQSRLSDLKEFNIAAHSGTCESCNQLDIARSKKPGSLFTCIFHQITISIRGSLGAMTGGQISLGTVLVAVREVLRWQMF